MVVGEVVVEIIVGSDGTWENHGLEEEVRLVVACLSVIMLTSKWSTFSNNPTIEGPLIALKRKKGIFMLNAGSVCLLGCLGCLLGLLPGFWLGSCLGLRVSQPHPDPDPHRSHEPAASRSPSPCSWIRDTYIYAPFPARWRGAANHPNLFLSMNGPVLLGWDNPSSASPACKYFLRESCSNYGSLDRSAIPFFLPQTDHI